MTFDMDKIIKDKKRMSLRRQRASNDEKIEMLNRLRDGLTEIHGGMFPKWFKRRRRKR